MRAKNHHIPVRSLVDAALNYNDNICASLIRSKELLVALKVLSFMWITQEATIKDTHFGSKSHP